MARSVSILILVLISMLPVRPSSPQVRDIFLREDFETLDNWRPLHFPKVKTHSVYSVEKEDDRSYLRAESNASASGVIHKQEFVVRDYPRIRWLWKISNVYEKGNAEVKSGDDYPMRVYITFKYDPEKASLAQRIIYGFARTLYGEYPPHSSLNYAWVNRDHGKRIITNKYAKEEKIIVMQIGPERAGTWIEEDVDIIRDYREAFATDPPPMAQIVLMNDSDDTGESSVSFMDYIEVYK
jgi:hypothetical protein